MASNPLVSYTKGNTAMVTYEGQSPSEIRTGDTVTDALGRTFVAMSDAALVMGDYSVLSDDGRSLILDNDSKVTISYDEDYWNAALTGEPEM
jgi:hypothetical protein